MLAGLLNLIRGRCSLGTQAGRLIMAVGLGLMSGSLIVCVGVYVWALFGWGRYFAAVHGVVSPETEFKPVDWVMTFIPLYGKEWGLVAMTLRQMLIVPTVLLVGGNPYPALLMGLPYYIGGFISQRYAVMMAEFINGAIIWWMVG